MVVECRGTKLWPVCVGASQYGLYPKRGILGCFGEGSGGGRREPTNKQTKRIFCALKKGTSPCTVVFPLFGQPTPPPSHPTPGPPLNRYLIILENKISYNTIIQLYNNYDSSMKGSFLLLVGLANQNNWIKKNTHTHLKWHGRPQLWNKIIFLLLPPPPPPSPQRR
jgi:hypothetical protein